MSLTGKNNEEKIWNFLTGKGLNSYGAAGLMGNLFAESGLNPHNLQNTYEKKLGYTDDSYTEAVDSGKYTGFTHDSAGYGLAQWTYWSRKEALLNYVKVAGASIGDLETQLGFLWKELGENYAAVLATLKKATSVRQASDAVLLKYEQPKDQSASVQTKRASYGQTYFDKYATKTTNDTQGGKTMSNSSLVDCTVYSPNHSGKRTHSIDRLTPHCVVGQLSAETIGACFPKGRDASCNYGIGYDGRVCLIVDECNRLYAGEPGDDTTVAAVRVRERKPVNLMIGPPADPADVGKMMALFFAKEGKKIVCGGTTSKLAANYLHEDVVTSLDYGTDPDIPPTATIKGVDLVTEGVITLSRVVEYANVFLNNSDLANLWSLQTDGASRIAQYLFEYATDISTRTFPSLSALRYSLSSS